jgi:flagellar protein FlgJ
MNLDPLHRSVAASDLSLEQVAASKQLDEPQKVARASQAFEALLLRQILTEAQKPQFGQTSSSSRTVGEVYQDMISERMAEQIAAGGSLGLARSLGTQLQRQLKIGSSGHSEPLPASQPMLSNSTQVRLPSHD